MSARSIEMLLDLVDIKLSSIHHVADGDEVIKLEALEGCRRELMALRAARKGALPTATD